MKRPKLSSTLLYFHLQNFITMRKTKEQKNVENLLKALMEVDYDQAAAAIEKLEENCAVPEIKIGFNYLVSIPFTCIPSFVKLAIGNPDEYTKEESKVLVRNSLDRNKAIAELLSQKFHVPKDDEIPFTTYADAAIFYAEETNNTIEDIFWVKDEAELKVGGATNLDIQLYCVATKFIFEETERLLKLGARPNVGIENEEWYLDDRISAECSFLGMEVLPILLGERKFQNNDQLERFLYDLIGLAAHEKMWSLIKPYIKDE